MMRHRFRDHREEMERMRRRRERMNVLFCILFGFVIVGGLAAGAFLLTHPEAIGAYFGRMAVGAKDPK